MAVKRGEIRGDGNQTEGKKVQRQHLSHSNGHCRVDCGLLMAGRLWHPHFTLYQESCRNIGDPRTNPATAKLYRHRVLGGENLMAMLAET